MMTVSERCLIHFVHQPTVLLPSPAASVRFEQSVYVVVEGSIIDVCLIKDLETAQETLLFAVTQNDTASSEGLIHSQSYIYQCLLNS